MLFFKTYAHKDEYFMTLWTNQYWQWESIVETAYWRLNWAIFQGWIRLDAGSKGPLLLFWYRMLFSEVTTKFFYCCIQLLSYALANKKKDTVLRQTTKTFTLSLNVLPRGHKCTFLFHGGQMPYLLQKYHLACSTWATHSWRKAKQSNQSREVIVDWKYLVSL